MSLKTSYRLIAPFYDAFIQGATASQRRHSLAQLPQQSCRVLISGAGTGLDFPHLPPHHQYTALDLTHAMLARSRERVGALDLQLVRGDSMTLPFPDASFDCAVLHLIVAVVPQPQRCLAEAARVVRPGGKLLVFDKFLRRGERAWLRRGLSPVVSQLATRLDVVFEDLIAGVPSLRVASDVPALAGGWFRRIELIKED